MDPPTHGRDLLNSGGSPGTLSYPGTYCTTRGRLAGERGSAPQCRLRRSGLARGRGTAGRDFLPEEVVADLEDELVDAANQLLPVEERRVGAAVVVGADGLEALTFAGLRVEAEELDAHPGGGPPAGSVEDVRRQEAGHLLTPSSPRCLLSGRTARS